MKNHERSVRYLLGVCLLAVSVLMPRSANAQVIQPLGAAPFIGGVQVNCNGISAYVANIPDVAQANGLGIFLHPNLFQLPAVVQIFIYAHECAHLVAVGGNEPAADCWAAKVGRYQGWLAPQGIALVASYFINSPGNWTHAPGPERVQNMLQCYNSP